MKGGRRGRKPCRWYDRSPRCPECSRGEAFHTKQISNISLANWQTIVLKDENSIDSNPKSNHPYLNVVDTNLVLDSIDDLEENGDCARMKTLRWAMSKSKHRNTRGITKSSTHKWKISLASFFKIQLSSLPKVSSSMTIKHQCSLVRSRFASEKCRGKTNLHSVEHWRCLVRWCIAAESARRKACRATRTKDRNPYAPLWEWVLLWRSMEWTLAGNRWILYRSDPSCDDLRRIPTDRSPLWSRWGIAEWEVPLHRECRRDSSSGTICVNSASPREDTPRGERPASRHCDRWYSRPAEREKRNACRDAECSVRAFYQHGDQWQQVTLSFQHAEYGEDHEDDSSLPRLISWLFKTPASMWCWRIFLGCFSPFNRIDQTLRNRSIDS